MICCLLLLLGLLLWRRWSGFGCFSVQAGITSMDGQEEVREHLKSWHADGTPMRVSGLLNLYYAADGARCLDVDIIHETGLMLSTVETLIDVCDDPGHDHTPDAVTSLIEFSFKMQESYKSQGLAGTVEHIRWEIEHPDVYLAEWQRDVAGAALFFNLIDDLSKNTAERVACSGLPLLRSKSKQQEGQPTKYFYRLPYEGDHPLMLMHEVDRKVDLNADHWVLDRCRTALSELDGLDDE